jgi:hypothetical protein
MAITSGLYAVDNSLIGSWGLVDEYGDKTEMVRFNGNEVIFMNTLFRQHEYTEANDSIYFNDSAVIMQYYLLAPNKLLFIIWDTENAEESITLILSRL